jgi:hypothetical protein
MNRILEIDRENLMVTVEPGVLTREIHRARDGWAWFATDAGPYNGSLFDGGDELNELGSVYHNLLRQAQENRGRSEVGT